MSVHRSPYAGRLFEIEVGGAKAVEVVVKYAIF